MIEDVMILAIKKARQTMNENIGGPFGAAIIDYDGTILSISSNSVLRDHDPTAHAEVNAIREAGQKRGTHDLSGCILYTTCYPCPMCLSAVIWSNIKVIYYACSKEDAAKIGFRDDFIYQFIVQGAKDESVIWLKQLNRELAIPLFDEYKEKSKTMY